MKAEENTRSLRLNHDRFRSAATTGSMEFRITPGDLFGSVLARIVEQLAYRLRRAVRQGRIGDQAFKFDVQVHISNSTGLHPVQAHEQVVPACFVVSLRQ